MPLGLEPSNNHLMLVNDDDAPIPASMVKIGDSIRDAVVESICLVARQGVYTLFTPTGVLTVNGVMIQRSYNLVCSTPCSHSIGCCKRFRPRTVSGATGL